MEETQNQKIVRELQGLISRKEFAKIPQDWLTEEYLTYPLISYYIDGFQERASYQQNCLHISFRNGSVKEIIPQRVLTLSNLQKKESLFGCDCFHIAANSGYVDMIPAEFVTFNNFTTRSDNRKTPFDYLLENKHQKQIPQGLFHALIEDKIERDGLRQTPEELEQMYGVMTVEEARAMQHDIENRKINEQSAYLNKHFPSTYDPTNPVSRILEQIDTIGEDLKATVSTLGSSVKLMKNMDHTISMIDECHEMKRHL